MHENTQLFQAYSLTIGQFSFQIESAGQHSFDQLTKKPSAYFGSILIQAFIYISRQAKQIL